MPTPKIKTLTLDETIDRMKHEILADMNDGKVPRTVKSFAELHDYVDANEYGGFCDEAFSNGMINWFGGRGKDDGLPEGYSKYINDAQNAIDAWLVKLARNPL